MAEALDFSDVEDTIQRARLQLYRENIQGALDLLDAAALAHPDPRYVTEAESVRQRLLHVQSREFLVPIELGAFFVAMTAPAASG